MILKPGLGNISTDPTPLLKTVALFQQMQILQSNFNVFYLKGECHEILGLKYLATL